MRGYDPQRTHSGTHALAWRAPLSWDAHARIRLALFEPDLPQNAGALMRTCACLNVALDIIEPCGFHFGDKHLKRAGLDYLDRANVVRHPTWADFRAACRSEG